MIGTKNDDVWLKIASAWLPYLGDEAEKLVLRSWTGDGVARFHPPALFSEDGTPLPRRPRRTESGQRTESSMLERRLISETIDLLAHVRDSAAKANATPLPNWFELSLLRDGSYEASFTYCSEADAEFSPKREGTVSDQVSSQAWVAIRQARGSVLRSRRTEKTRMDFPKTEVDWTDIASMWLPYLGSEAEKLRLNCFIDEGFAKFMPVALFGEDDLPFPPRLVRDELGGPTDLFRLRKQLVRLTTDRLEELHAEAASSAARPLPNWFEMTVARDGEHSASFTFSAAAEAEYNPPRSTSDPDQGSDLQPVEARTDVHRSSTTERTERPTTRPPLDTNEKPDSGASSASTDGDADASIAEPNDDLDPEAREILRRVKAILATAEPMPEPEEPDSPDQELTAAEERALIARTREMARTNLDNLFAHPDDERWLDRFLHTHVSLNTARVWEEARMGLSRKDDGSTRVFQEVRWEGREDFESLPIAEPMWLLDALEQVRVRHGENGSERRDLTVHLAHASMRLEWGPTVLPDGDR